MNRRNFLRNITLSIAASLVPRILQPTDSEILADNDSYGGIFWHIQNLPVHTFIYEPRSFIIEDFNAIIKNYYDNSHLHP